MFKLDHTIFAELSLNFNGELYFNNSAQHQAILKVYSTDASVYQEKPLAVAIPKTENDIKNLIEFASNHALTLIPRAAGTSLAGQVVGRGVVVDISKNFNKIIEVNQAEKWVRVQPGVIRDDLNAALKPYGLLFGPETSTASRAMIGGMIGNNSCGLHSIIWGNTRDNLLSLKAILSDGSSVEFSGQFINGEDSFANTIYNNLLNLIKNPENRAAIEAGFPRKEVKRRNSGYALDALLNDFDETNVINLCNLIAGSEGTLCFITEAKLKLIDLPPTHAGMVAIHCKSLHESLLANLVAISHDCSASELVDDFILEFTKTECRPGNTEQAQNELSSNRFFIEGEPKAILMVEFFDDSIQNLELKLKKLIEDLQNENLGYAHPMLFGEDCKKAWEVRKSGLGLLRNLKGDTQCVNLIEDCAVSPQDLPNYIEDLEILLKKHQLQYSMYAHAGAGELHVEPMINLKTSEGKAIFKKVLQETAILVKKYKGSLSGEHGDGRLRGEFIPFVMGEKNYELFKEVKQIFDPKGIFNRGKITGTPPMNEFLRYEQDQQKQEIPTIFDFSEQEGILRLAEKCSGSGDCRKTEITGGTMCPSYMATRQEKDTTRARANILRQYFSPVTKVASTDAKLSDSAPTTELEVKEILDLCLSCKACKSECPSSVDIGKMKAEFLQSYYDKNGVPFRSLLIANFSKLQQLASYTPTIYNFLISNELTSKLIKKISGFHAKRSIPKLSKTTLKNSPPAPRGGIKIESKTPPLGAGGLVYLFCDEFSNYLDAEVGVKLISLLEKLGYKVIIPNHFESGRTYLSKGLVRDAQKLAIKNVEKLKDLISDETPMIGIEPSAILTFRDEYLDLVPENLRADAQRIAKNCLLFEEWFAQEIKKGNIKKEQFTTEKRLIKLHGHCHQKALTSLTPSKIALSLPQNYEVQLIPSGCCGMAGAFGYEKEHYEVSMKVGELVLFPTIRQQNDEVIIAAAGTSCRHQIKDGTSRIAKHPAEILFEALKN